MTESIPALVRATISRTGLRKAFVEQRARQLQDAGLLPVAVGTSKVAAQPRHLTHLLISLAAARVRSAPALVHEYAALARIGDHSPRLAGDAIEQLIARIWSGDKADHGKVVHIVSTWPEFIITERADNVFAGEHFYEPGAVMEFHGLDAVRRVLEIPVCVVAQIGADIGFQGCRYAI
jgi:hypothetical protein